MSARAAEERRARGVPQEELTPWWRVLRKGGFLNPKLPGGVERQAVLLAAEGVRSSPLRKQVAVYDYEARRPERNIEEA
jgi:alkylated DNA nucleotide flippase Atl1